MSAERGIPMGRTSSAIISPDNGLHWPPICRRFSTESGYPRSAHSRCQRQGGFLVLDAGSKAHGRNGFRARQLVCLPQNR